MLMKVFPICFLLSHMVVVHAAVTNEDIRLAILQIVNIVRNTDDKLERHEFREKIVADQLKKGLINIDKRIKMLDPIKGTVSRIDERLAAIETILMQKDKEEKERQAQQQKIYEVILDLQKNLPLVINQLNQDLSQKIVLSTPPEAISEPMMTKDDFTKVEKEFIDRMDKMTSSLNNMKAELANIREESFNNMKNVTNKSSESLEKVKRQLDNSELLLSKYESKLAEYNNKIPEILPRNSKEDEEWKETFLKELANQKIQVTDILANVKTVQTAVNALPDKSDIDLVRNTTLHKLAEIQAIIPADSSQAIATVGSNVQNMKSDLVQIQDNVTLSFNQVTDLTSLLTESFSKNYEDIRTEVKDLGKLEKVIMQTADAIMDNKRRIEYGNVQVISEIKKHAKSSAESVSQEFNERFDTFEASIIDEESGALNNLTAKIQEEIGRVWRQIGIMHQQMSVSTDTLNKLQNQTDAYVDGSLHVMDSMKGKVTTVTTRMSEVEENLNFLLGKLSLLSHEFNSIKSGLGSTLDEIRSTFQSVQTKIKDKGPGPHKISSNEIVE
ncbi:uncharacterized protein LOC143206812 [Rhynchophorus ferrugineus]|uniref:Uncharacterized protein n=1 Tax=Rhynchophorus ferrugineus TaxID=354439 RepID=A0A834HT39_RHYFE|nr:hypothetical protein GWI33_020115 [Rhynchophorus ferrugineus]